MGTRGDIRSTTKEPTIEWVEIEPLQSISDYNTLMLKGVAKHIKSSHALIVQWDGFVSNPELWNEEFLEWDYIGAPWPHRDPKSSVGNGGFSLRSRKLLEALTQIETDGSQPEDHEICINKRSILERDFDIRFAPPEIAKTFAIEYGSYTPSFGFHGMHNFAHVMAPEELLKWLDTCPSELIEAKHTRNLIKSLIRSGRRTEARALISRRSQKIGWTWDQASLALRSVLAPTRSASSD